jgi:hypothetical protein
LCYNELPGRTLEIGTSSKGRPDSWLTGINSWSTVSGIQSSASPIMGHLYVQNKPILIDFNQLEYMTEVFAKTHSLSLFSFKSLLPALYLTALTSNILLSRCQNGKGSPVSCHAWMLPNAVDSYEQNNINKNVQFFFYFLDLFNPTLKFNLS